MTRHPAQNPALDIDALADWMSRSGIEFSGALSARRVGKGHSNLTYRITDEAGGSWIARRPPLGHLLQSAHDVVREARIMAALGPTDVPVPAILGVSDPGPVAAVPVVLIQDVAGLVIDEIVVAEQLPVDIRHAVGINAATTLARIHGVDIDAAGLGDLASRAPYAERQLRRWSRQWEASRTRDLEALDRLTAVLQSAVPHQERVCLVHGDFHLRNIIIEPTSGAVAAALDWELSTLGDPLADLGSTLAYWPERGEETHALFAGSAVEGFPRRAELVGAYCQASGADAAAIGFWHVLGIWKVAIIAEGVLRRVLDQPENAAQGELVTPGQVSGLIEAAWGFAEEYRLM
ncbi:phosphotransferase family protein [soil metagenome]